MYLVVVVLIMGLFGQGVSLMAASRLMRGAAAAETLNAAEDAARHYAEKRLRRLLGVILGSVVVGALGIALFSPLIDFRVPVAFFLGGIATCIAIGVSMHMLVRIVLRIPASAAKQAFETARRGSFSVALFALGTVTVGLSAVLLMTRGMQMGDMVTAFLAYAAAAVGASVVVRMGVMHALPHKKDDAGRRYAHGVQGGVAAVADVLALLSTAAYAVIAMADTLTGLRAEASTAGLPEMSFALLGTALLALMVGSLVTLQEERHGVLTSFFAGVTSSSAIAASGMGIAAHALTHDTRLFFAALTGVALAYVFLFLSQLMQSTDDTLTRMSFAGLETAGFFVLLTLFVGTASFFNTPAAPAVLLTAVLALSGVALAMRLFAVLTKTAYGALHALDTQSAHTAVLLRLTRSGQHLAKSGNGLIAAGLAGTGILLLSGMQSELFAGGSALHREGWADPAFLAGIFAAGALTAGVVAGVTSLYRKTHTLYRAGLGGLGLLGLVTLLGVIYALFGGAGWLGCMVGVTVLALLLGILLYALGVASEHEAERDITAEAQTDTIAHMLLLLPLVTGTTLLVLIRLV